MPSSAQHFDCFTVWEGSRTQDLVGKAKVKKVLLRKQIVLFTEADATHPDWWRFGIVYFYR